MERRFQWVGMGVTVLWTLMALAPGALAQQGVTKDKILIGSFGAMTGPAAVLGLSMKEGIEVYIKKANDEGGVYGRKLEFVWEDDANEPGKAIAAIRKLAYQDRVFAILGATGSNATTPALPALVESGLPTLTDTVMADGIANPPKKNIFHGATSNNDNARMMVDWLVVKLNAKKVCFAFQDDIAGQQALAGARDQLPKYKLQLVAAEGYKQGATDYSSQVSKLRAAGCDGVLINGGTKSHALIVNEAYKIGWRPKWVGSPGTSTPEFAQLTGEAGIGVYAASWVDDTANSPTHQEFRNRFKQMFPNKAINFFHMHVYGLAMVFVEALKRSGPEPTQAKMIENLEKMRGYTAGGLLPALSFSAGGRSAMKTTFIMELGPRGWKLATPEPVPFKE